MHQSFGIQSCNVIYYAIFRIHGVYVKRSDPASFISNIIFYIYSTFAMFGIHDMMEFLFHDGYEDDKRGGQRLWSKWFFINGKRAESLPLRLQTTGKQVHNRERRFFTRQMRVVSCVFNQYDWDALLLGNACTPKNIYMYLWKKCGGHECINVIGENNVWGSKLWLATGRVEVKTDILVCHL